MAYRQLFFVACVYVGVGLTGCGGESASSAVDPATNDSTPSNPDAPPSGADDSPPSSDDPAPSGAETPPGSTDGPVGSGDFQSLCRDMCRFIEELSECVAGDQEIDAMGLDELCSSNCNVPEPTEPIRCQQEIAAMFNCLNGLASLCPENGGEAQVAMCQDEATRFTACNGGEEPVDDPEPSGSCTLEDSCQGCDDPCDACQCASPDAPEQCDVICEQ